MILAISSFSIRQVRFRLNWTMAVSSGVALVFVGKAWGGRGKGWIGWPIKGWPTGHSGWPTSPSGWLLVGKGWPTSPSGWPTVGKGWPVLFWEASQLPKALPPPFQGSL